MDTAERLGCLVASALLPFAADPSKKSQAESKGRQPK